MSYYNIYKLYIYIYIYIYISLWGFPCSSVSKESAYNAGDLGLIPGSGRSTGEGNGSPFQYSCLENAMDRGAWQAIVHVVARTGHDLATKPIPHIFLYGASLGAQMVKNPPAMWETWVQSLGWEDPLEKGMATHSSILACRILWTERPSRLQSMGLQRVGYN